MPGATRRGLEGPEPESAFGQTELRRTAFARDESEGWRRGRDSNPWNPFRFNGFQDRRLKPLGHLSNFPWGSAPYPGSVACGDPGAAVRHRSSMLRRLNRLAATRGGRAGAQEVPWVLERRSSELLPSGRHWAVGRRTERHAGCGRRLRRGRRDRRGRPGNRQCVEQSGRRERRVRHGRLASIRITRA